MVTIAELTIRNGFVTETYSVERDQGSIFIRNVLDLEAGGPCDTMHIDAKALRPLAFALLAAEGPPIHDGAQVVIPFPRSASAMYLEDLRRKSPRFDEVVP